MPDLSPEAREALKIAQTLSDLYKSRFVEKELRAISAALLEARAAQIEEMASPAQTLWLDDAKRLRRQAQALREGSK